MLGSHGLFTWGDTAYESYLNTLETIEKCAEYLEQHYGKEAPVFGGQKIQSLAETDRKKQAVALAPILRGFCSSKTKMIGHFTDDMRVLEFINSNDLERLAPMGTSCPDHFLRTKISPLVLELNANADLTDVAAIKEKLEPAFETYRNMYAEYYNQLQTSEQSGHTGCQSRRYSLSGCWYVHFCKGQTNGTCGIRILYKCHQCDEGCRSYFGIHFPAAAGSI